MTKQAYETSIPIKASVLFKQVMTVGVKTK